MEQRYERQVIDKDMMVVRQIGIPLMLVGVVEQEEMVMELLIHQMMVLVA